MIHPASSPEALSALRACSSETESRLEYARETQRLLEELTENLSRAAANESAQSPARRILGEVGGHLVRAVAGLEGYATVMKLLLPVRTDAGELLAAAQGQCDDVRDGSSSEDVRSAPQGAPND